MKTIVSKIIIFIMIATVFGCTEKSKTIGSDKTIYSCTMHRQVREDKHGPCPICGMDMVIVPDINNW